MNALTEETVVLEAKPAPRAPAKAWLRYPLLIATALLLAVLTMKARELTVDILAAIEPVAEWFNAPF